MEVRPNKDDLSVGYSLDRGVLALSLTAFGSEHHYSGSEEEEALSER